MRGVSLPSLRAKSSYSGLALRRDLVWRMNTEPDISTPRLRDVSSQLLHDAEQQGMRIRSFRLDDILWEASVELRRLRNEKVKHTGMRKIP